MMDFIFRAKAIHSCVDYGNKICTGFLSGFKKKSVRGATNVNNFISINYTKKQSTFDD